MAERPTPLPAPDPLLRRLRMRDLQLLAMLDEVGSLSAAAAALSLTQPAVSKILVELEQIFGSRLFERGRRGVEPTPIGLAAIRRARSIVGELGLASAELKAMREGAAGLLQLGTFSITDIVPKALAELMRRHPGVAVRIREGAIAELLTLLLQGELDCVFAAMPPDLLARGEIRRLRWQAMFDDRLCALLSDRHPLAGGRALRWRDLAQARWVAMPTDTVVRQRFMEAFVGEGLEPPQPVVETLSPITIAALVREDPSLIGLARHESAGQQSLLPGIRRLALDPKMPLPSMCLITRRSAEGEGPLLKSFADCIRAAARSRRL